MKPNASATIIPFPTPAGYRLSEMDEKVAALLVEGMKQDGFTEAQIREKMQRWTRARAAVAKGYAEANAILAGQD